MKEKMLNPLRKIVWVLVVFLFSNTVKAQTTADLKIWCNINFDNTPITLNNALYQMKNGNTIKFETLKFYISNVQLLQNNAVVFAEQNSFHLIDLSDSASLNFVIKQSTNISFNRIKFNLGIDSITNVSGAMGGDLDPTKGMYWAWQSGYINFKMEGTCSQCLATKNNFEFHLGGYQQPFYAMKTIELSTTTKNEMMIYFDVNKFLTQLDLTTQQHIMSPCDEAVTLSKKLANCFTTK